MAGSVIAVSVSRPRWQEMYGRKIFSAIVREPSPTPLHFTAGGPEGNATAVHTEQVYACFAEHYALWAERLGVERSAWGQCHWGENLMLAGMPLEEDLYIGDRFRIGQALLEVTSPRIPCFKLCWRLGQPESFLSDLIASGRMGAYFRVIEPGLIGHGDEARLETPAEDSISVMRLSALLHDPSVTNLDVLSRVLATPALGGQATGMIRNRINALTDGQLGQRNRWHGWRAFRVAAVERETDLIRSFIIEPADGAAIGGYRAGQFLTVRLPERAGSLVRSWSISDYDQQRDSYRISIKREPAGAASRFMHDELNVGELLEVRPPSGRFVIDRGGFMRIVMISAGIGVTPLLAMLKAHAERPNPPPLLWLHCVRSPAELAFAGEVDAVLAKLDGGERQVFYSRNGSDAPVSDARNGRLDATAIGEIVAGHYSVAPFGREIELPAVFSDFYVCGPEGFIAMVKASLEARGVNPDLIRTELFSASGQVREVLPTPEQSLIRFVRSGKQVLWRKDDGQTILDAAAQAGITIPSGCRMGNCETCEIAILKGEVGYVMETAAVPREGRILACCSQPLTDDIMLDG